MKVRRDISSIPLRTAEETWETIVGLVTGEGTIDGDQLKAAASVMVSLITDEAFKDHPLTMTGVSHRLVIYLLHGPDALETGADVDRLATRGLAKALSITVAPNRSFRAKGITVPRIR